MRYYNIEITGTTSATYTSYPNGQVDPGALAVEFDITAFDFSAPVGYAHVRIHGVSLQTVGQASDFNGATVKMSAGMVAGLPLVNPAQRGLILQGKVFQAFGNWIDTDMTLDLMVATDGGSTDAAPFNIVLNWHQGNKMADAIKTTLAVGYPGTTANINISDKLVLTEPDTGYYKTIQEFSAHMTEVSKSIISDPAYAGVTMTLDGTTFNVYDGTVTTTAKAIDFKDMIGQPTWIGPYQVQANFVLRADLKVGDYIKFPPALATSTEAQMATQPQARSVFQGTFQIDTVRHVGNSRQADAQSWITVVDCHGQPPADGSGAAAQPDNVG